ncbi:Set1 complex component spp1 [Chaetomidium leptoderma]|uniref:Set1 complex component spp1 n=1 Tax=Chaetomidium leptoderma TaxID=669021 RepID=A0AAN7A1P1_9PEZI|nr:Set1 complex component spp1 [Chaetomidium leptoderma]
MAFSSSFCTPSDLAPVADGSQPQREPQTINKESPTTTQGETPNPHRVREESSPNMPHSDGIDHEMGDDASVTGNSTHPAPKSKKKKGTAATVKAPPKRARPSAGGAKKKSGGSKKPKTDASSKQAGGADTTADGGNSSESDNGPYCLCRGPDDHRFMIACDRCEDWYHGECIGMDKHTGEKLVQKYICPHCTEGGRYTTRYKKMCSLAGCSDPARIYDSARPSIFCSPEHCQAWWEQLIATLPRTAKGTTAADHLTQEEFMGLLDAPPLSPSQPDDTTDLPTGRRPWHLGKPPFETPPNFWDLPTSSCALTPEEQALLTTSATARYQLGEEIVLCKKMLQLIDMALKQREAAIAAGKGTAKDLCGYDVRLDTVSATHQFALFLQTPRGEAIFKSGRLDVLDHTTTTTTTNNPDEQQHQQQQQPQPPPSAIGPNGTASSSSTDSNDLSFANMCPKKKCKPHNGWSAILAKSVRHDMKELAAQAKEMLDAEQRVRDGAAGRFRRRIKEGNGVVLC